MARKKSSRKPRTNTKPISRQKKVSKGLGDTVEAVFEATGIATVAKWILGEDCGCDSRRDTLNRIFPYRKPNCLNESEYIYLKDHFESKTTTITPNKQRRMVDIYNRVFNEKKMTTACSSCFLNSVHKELEKVYKQY